MLSTADGRCFSLRGVAGRLWTLLERGASLRTISELVRREYGVPAGWIETELPALLQSLVRAGLIERSA